MFTDPVALIDQTITNLETLAALFADEFDERMHDRNSLPAAGRLCREAHSRIGALLPALQAARAIQQADAPQPYARYCVDCE